MIRLLGSVIILVGAGFLGLKAASALHRGTRSVEGVLTSLELLERELAFHLTALPQLFQDLSARAPEPGSHLFSACAREMNAGRCLSDVWPRLLEETPELDGVLSQALSPLGQVLGRYEAEGQQQAICAVTGQLRQLLSYRRGEALRLGKVYRVLGLSAGAALVVLLW